MVRVFAYVRISPATAQGGHADRIQNQIQALQGRGFKIPPGRIIEDICPPTMPLEERPGFQILLNRIEAGDELVFTHIDRLACRVLDILLAADELEALGVRLRFLDIEPLDISTIAGRFMLHKAAAETQFLYDQHNEATQAGVARARAVGSAFGRPPALAKGDQAKVLERLAAGETISAIARAAGVGRATILRLREANKVAYTARPGARG